MVQPKPHRLGVADAAAAIAAGTLTATALAESCLARIAARDAEVRAWVTLEADRVLDEARRRAAEAPRGPLHGVPLGVKDIIDTADLPTERGSALFRGRRPTRDAVCVARLRAAGAIVFGKTVTTEFAYFAPGPTRNPHDPRHTPGGSSSGSAAAVADAQVPGALGTQTAGSVIRPASFNGVVGFKPTYGAIPVEGVLPLAPSLDTVGLFAREARDLPPLFSVLADDATAPPTPTAPPAIALVRTPYWERGDPAMRAALEGFASDLTKSGIAVEELDGTPLDGLAELQSALLVAEAHDVLTPLVARDPEAIRPETRRLLAEDAGDLDALRAALAPASVRGMHFLEERVFARGAFALTPAAPGEAPAGLDATGDPLFNRIWTLLGLPCLSLPIGTGAAGLPLGAQLVGPRDGDAALLAAATDLQTRSDYAVTLPA